LQPDSETRIDADEIIQWAACLGVTPEELRSAVQKGGTMVKDVVAELARRGFEPTIGTGVAASRHST
jgi:hypothetical protein